MNVNAAAARLAPYAFPTPLVRAPLLSRDLGCDLWVKNETVSPVASFKWRGALNDLLRDGPRPRAVVTSSTGNHGQGVAWAARTLGIPAHVFLPSNPNPTKRAKIALLGATIHETGYDLDDAKAQAIAFAREDELRFVDDGESEGVIEGAGTVGAEIAKTLERIDTVFVPMGSGSLAAGVAMAVKQVHPRTQVVAVQSSGSPAMVESFHQRQPVERPANTIADGLVCRVPAAAALETLVRFVDDAVTVSDDEILSAARTMILGAHVLVEPSGAAGLAAALRENVQGKTIVVIATGSNVTPELFARLHV